MAEPVPLTGPLERQYARLEARFTPTPDQNYERLVVPTGAADESVHRWFRMKEAYSPYLMPRLLKDLELNERGTLTVHDPFVGSGTTLVSSLVATDGPVVTGTGIEANPFLALLAGVKVEILSMKSRQRRDLAEELSSLASLVSVAATDRAEFIQPPSLSALNNPLFFSIPTLQSLLQMRNAWLKLQASTASRLIGIALASCLEPCSQLRRDGRALRHVKGKSPAQPVEEFLRRIGEICKDLEAVTAQGTASVRQGNAMSPAGWPEDDSVDLVCFSPPYPNNIDYTEVYKLEAWFLLLIPDRDAFLAQRRSTMRSHPSVKFADHSWEDLPATLMRSTKRLGESLLAAVPDNRYRAQRLRTIQGFLTDSMIVFYRAHRALRPGGRAVYVVGNSRHGTEEQQFTIAADILLADIAEKVGFTVDEVKVARFLHRRGQHEHLRESVVFLSKRRLQEDE